MFNNFMDYEYQPYHKIYVHEGSNYGIYLGDVSAAMDLDFIQNQPIKLVVTAAKGMDQVVYPQGIVKHIIYPLLDAKTQNISQFFSQFYQLVQKQIYFGNILVHCAAGISRVNIFSITQSATLVIAYCMKKNNLTFKQAIKLVRDKRPIVLPNLGFERQLKEFQIALNQQVRRQPNTSQVDRKILINSSQIRKNLVSPSKIDFLPDINHFGKTSWIRKAKPQQRNIQSPFNGQMLKDLAQRKKVDILTRKSQHNQRQLKKKGNHFRNISKEMIFAKLQNGRRKLFQRPNNLINGNGFKENIQMIEEGPSLSIKKLSSLSHRSEKKSLDRKIVKNFSNHKYESDQNLLEEMGRFVVTKLHLNERKFTTEKQLRGRRIADAGLNL